MTDKYYLVWIFEKDKGAIMNIDRLVNEMHVENKDASDEFIARMLKRDLSASQVIKAKSEEHAVSLFNNNKSIVKLNLNRCTC